MVKVSLSRMNVESLIELRDQVDQRLREHRIEMQKQLERMDRAIAALGGQTCLFCSRASSESLGWRRPRRTLHQRNPLRNSPPWQEAIVLQLPAQPATAAEAAAQERVALVG
jgi:hypothetical protein